VRAALPVYIATVFWKVRFEAASAKRAVCPQVRHEDSDHTWHRFYFAQRLRNIGDRSLKV